MNKYHLMKKEIINHYLNISRIKHDSLKTNFFFIIRLKKIKIEKMINSINFI